jgi:chromosome segregation ATPase
LKQQEADLLLKLEQTRKDLASKEKKLADFLKAIKDQRSKLKSLACQLADQSKVIKPVPGFDANDLRTIDEVDQIRLPLTGNTAAWEIFFTLV